MLGTVVTVELHVSNFKIEIAFLKFFYSMNILMSLYSMKKHH